MLLYDIERNRDIVRQSLKRVNADAVRVTNANIDHALNYFEKQTDHGAVRDKLKQRFAIGIRKTKGEAGYETYTKARTKEMIEQGEYETVTSGVGTRIINALSSLFTMRTQYWDYLEDDEPNEDVADTISTHRELGKFSQEIVDADYISCAVETGPMLISWGGGHLKYDAFSPACIYAKYHDQIWDNGELRGVDYTDIDDASVIVIELNSTRGSGQSSPDLSQYLAIFGRSEEYPLGRHVYYTARNWEDWPEINMGGVDWLTSSGEIANPLSLLASQNSEYLNTEYPVILLRGGFAKTSENLIPVSTSLFESCLEIDVAFSRLLKDSLSSARGKDVLTNEFNNPLPTMLEGAVVLHKGQTLQIMGQPVGNAQGALDIVKALSRSVAEGFSVPGYQIISEVGGVPESGVALFIRTAPLIDHRESRIKINKPEIDRLFEIERGLHEIYTGNTIGSANLRQVWNPGRYVLPESQTEKTTRLKAALDAGFIDYVRAVRDYHDLPTDKDAIEFIEKMEERKEDNPGPQPAQPQQPMGARLGLPMGLQPRKPRV